MDLALGLLFSVVGATQDVLADFSRTEQQWSQWSVLQKTKKCFFAPWDSALAGPKSGTQKWHFFQAGSPFR